MTKPNAVALVGTCPHCGEPVEMIITKKQAKIIYKGFQQATPSKANLFTELKMKLQTK